MGRDMKPGSRRRWLRGGLICLSIPEARGVCAPVPHCTIPAAHAQGCPFVPVLNPCLAGAATSSEPLNGFLPIEACGLTPLHSTHPAKPSSNRQLMYHAVSSQFIWSNVTLQAQPWVCRKVWQSRFKIEKWKFSPVSFMIMNVKTYSWKQVCVCIHSVKPPIDFYGDTVAEIFREAFIFSLIFSLSSG